MKDEYIIINKTEVFKMIKNLEQDVKFYFKNDLMLDANKCLAAADALNNVLSKSTPLQPELEKAFEAGDNFRYYENNGSIGKPSHVLDKEDYISTFKIGQC